MMDIGRTLLRVIWTGRWRSFSKGTIRYYAGEFTGWRESYELWPAGDLAVTHAHFHFTPCSTLSKYFVTCSSEKRSVRRAR